MPGSPARELSRLVQLQRDKLQALESRLLGCEAEMQDWDDSTGEANQVSEAVRRPTPLPSSHQEGGIFFLKFQSRGLSFIREETWRRRCCYWSSW